MSIAAHWDTAGAPDLSASGVAAYVRDRRRQREPFVHLVSLGTNCYSAWLLKALGLKRASYPFDWVFSTPRMVIDMLEDDFARFLDPAEHCRVATETTAIEGLAQHLSYGRRHGIAAIFNHHDPTRPEIAAYLRRCVARFRAVLASPEKTLLLMVNAAEPLDPATFARLCGCIDAAGQANTLLCINTGSARDLLNIGMTEPYQVGRHRLRTYRSSSEMNGLAFANPIDDLVLRATILQYRLAVPPA